MDDDTTAGRYVPRDDVDGGWPDGEPRPGADPYTRYALGIARALRDERVRLGLRSDRALERHVGLTHGTFVRALNGDGVVDGMTICKIETALGRRVLPDPLPREGDRAREQAAGPS